MACASWASKWFYEERKRICVVRKRIHVARKWIYVRRKIIVSDPLNLPSLHAESRIYYSFIHSTIWFANWLIDMLVTIIKGCIPLVMLMTTKHNLRHSTNNRYQPEWKERLAHDHKIHNLHLDREDQINSGTLHRRRSHLMEAVNLHATEVAIRIPSYLRS